MRSFTEAQMEWLEGRRLMVFADPADTLAFAFALGEADVVGVATDAAGDVYVAGHFEGTVDFNPARRKTFALTATADDGDPFVAKYSPTGGLFWAVHFGKPNATPGRRDVFASTIAADLAGNVYVGGHFEQTVDFDPGAGTANLTAGANADGDGYVLALGPGGAFRYANRIATPGTADPDDVFRGSTVELGVDSAGHVYAATQVTKNFGTPSGGSAVVVDKFTARGRTLWTRSFGSVDRAGELLSRSLVTDRGGNAYLGGSVNGGVDFDPGSGTRTLAGANNYVLKLDPDGALAWVGGLADAFPFAMTADPSGNLYVAGGYSGTPDFNFSPRKSFGLTSVGGQDAFVARYSPAGNLAWARSIGGGSSDGAVAVTIASDGRVHVAGQFKGRASFNPGLSRFRLTSVTPTDTFLARYSTDGVFEDAGQISPRATGLVGLPAGGLFATGLLLSAGDVDAGAGVLDLEPVVPGRTSLFLLKLL